MKIMRSAEDYLEAMLMMQEQHGYIRSIDIAGELNVTKPSVSYATKRLAENGYINKAQDGAITLTDKGYEIAARIYERHKVLTYLLTYLGVDEKNAREDACRLEHDLSVETFDRIRECAERVRAREEAEKAAETGAQE
ncbi:MAG: metal-dependent transcriptional regulator [Clostridia bacterium]|nr:metal-dependent transcriptional regulator [Clostridia bacterium]